jgi:hypothetical protein
MVMNRFVMVRHKLIMVKYKLAMAMLKHKLAMVKHKFVMVVKYKPVKNMLGLNYNLPTNIMVSMLEERRRIIVVSKLAL